VQGARYGQIAQIAIDAVADRRRMFSNRLHIKIVGSYKAVSRMNLEAGSNTGQD
jgi:hypothetical protein